MKTKLIITLAVLGFAALIGIRIATYQPEDEVDIEDALAIFAYVFDDSATPEKLADGEYIPASFDKLVLGEVRYTGFNLEMENINLQFDFDGGTIEVESEACDVQLTAGDEKRPWDYEGGYWERQRGAKLNVPDGGYVAVNPISSGRGFLGFDHGDPDWDMSENYAGREHILVVRAYNLDDQLSPLVTAEIRLTQLGYPDSPDEIMVGYYAIELISYEYSDVYKLMDEEKPS